MVMINTEIYADMFGHQSANPRSDRHSRWICAREALLLQGIPTYPSLSFGRPLCSFAKPGSRIVDTGRTATIGQAGNAMHSQCVAMALLYAATQITIGSSQAVQGTPDVQTQPNVSTPSSQTQVQTKMPDLKRSRSKDESGTTGFSHGASSSPAAAPHAEKQVTDSRPVAKPRAKSTSIAKLMWQCTKVTASKQIKK